MEQNFGWLLISECEFIENNNSDTISTITSDWLNVAWVSCFIRLVVFAENGCSKFNNFEVVTVFW